KGVDMLADLGIIDDADETFVNSHRVGGLGKVPDGSAWQKDRLYRISAGLLADGDNLLAVHVWSQWGLGGMVGPPVLKAALAPADAEWEVAFRPSGGQPPDGLNTLRRTAEAVDRCLGSGRKRGMEKVRRDMGLRMAGREPLRGVPPARRPPRRGRAAPAP
ncbi:MAG: hypothetical protein IKS67_15085, partial [Victivallales bacterium]|nr:hypothetical protein [Victivallales bacterium]